MSGPGCKKSARAISILCRGIKLNKEQFFYIARRIYGHRVFCHNANSLILNTVCIKNCLSL